MSDRETPPNTSQSGASEKARHSGLLPEEMGGERPGDREFDNTPLHEAVEQGLIGETPESVEPLVQPQETPRAPREEPKPSVFEKLRKSKTAKIMAIGSAAVTAVTVAWGLKFMNDVSNAMENPTVPGVSGEQNPGGSDNEPNPDTAPVASGEIPAGLENPITLTSDEVAALESGVYEDGVPIMDTKLVPAVQTAAYAILENGGTADGLNLSNIFADKNTVSQMEDILSNYTQYEYGSYMLNFCTAEMGVSNCGPLQQSTLAVGKNIKFDTFFSLTNADGSYTDEEKGYESAMQPVVRDGKLVVASDGLLPSDPSK